MSESIVDETASVTCESCDVVSSVDEAEALFKQGLIVGISDDDNEITEAKKAGGIVLDITEDINALVEGEDLSEEFIDKAKTIFEAAVSRQVEAGRAALTEEITEQVRAEVNAQVEGKLGVQSRNGVKKTK